MLTTAFGRGADPAGGLGVRVLMAALMEGWGPAHAPGPSALVDLVTELGHVVDNGGLHLCQGIGERRAR